MHKLAPPLIVSALLLCACSQSETQGPTSTATSTGGTGGAGGAGAGGTGGEAGSAQGGSGGAAGGSGPVCTRTDYALGEVTSLIAAPDVITAAEAGVWGDDSTAPYALPWAFPFFGQSHTDVVLDTNGLLWLATAATSEHDISLAAGGTQALPVIAGWNFDLDSDSYGSGAEAQAMTGPDRVVVHWNTETHQDWDYDYLNDLSVVLFPNGYVLASYESFSTTNCVDSGSGISAANGTDYVDLTATYSEVCNLADRRFLFEPPCAADDQDDDGLSDAEESNAGTNPWLPDTDGDGLKDGWEVYLTGTDPTT